MTNGFMRAMINTVNTYNKHLAIAGELYTEQEQKNLRKAVSALLSTVGTNLAEGQTYEKQLAEAEKKFFKSS